MTEIAVREDYAPVTIDPADGLPPVIASLKAWADSARAASSIAESLVRTSFVPEAFRGKPVEATAAILAGAEVGLSPMASLRSFDIIQGTAAPRAITQRAVAQSQGHEIWVDEATATRAVVCGRRRGSDKVQRSVWTIDRARRLKLTGKSNWQNQPEAMLVARATSELCRLIASDALLGLPISIEELQDGVSVPTSEPDAETPRRTAKRASLAPVPDEPNLDDNPAIVSDDEPPLAPDDSSEPPEPATRAQITKLNIQLQEAGHTDRDEKLRFLSEWTGREITSSNELSKSEAHRLIEQFEMPAEPTFEDGA